MTLRLETLPDDSPALSQGIRPAKSGQEAQLGGVNLFNYAVENMVGLIQAGAISGEQVYEWQRTSRILMDNSAQVSEEVLQKAVTRIGAIQIPRNWTQSAKRSWIHKNNALETIGSFGDWETKRLAFELLERPVFNRGDEDSFLYDVCHLVNIGRDTGIPEDLVLDILEVLNKHVVSRRWNGPGPGQGYFPQLVEELYGPTVSRFVANTDSEQVRNAARPLLRSMLGVYQRLQGHWNLDTVAKGVRGLVSQEKGERTQDVDMALEVVGTLRTLLVSADGTFWNKAGNVLPEFVWLMKEYKNQTEIMQACREGVVAIIDQWAKDNNIETYTNNGMFSGIFQIELLLEGDEYRGKIDDETMLYALGKLDEFGERQGWPELYANRLMDRLKKLSERYQDKPTILAHIDSMLSKAR